MVFHAVRTPATPVTAKTPAVTKLIGAEKHIDCDQYNTKPAKGGFCGKG